MKRRESHVAYEGLTPPEFPQIPDAADIRSGLAEFFTGHLQYPNKRLELGLAHQPSSQLAPDSQSATGLIPWPS